MRQTYETTTTPESNSQRAWDFMKANIREIAHNVKEHPARVGASVAATIGITAAAAGCGGTEANHQPGSTLTFSSSASATSHEAPKSSNKPVSPTDIPSTTSTQESSPSSASHEALPQPSLAELNTLAKSGELVNKDITWRARWASQYNLGLKQSPEGAIQDNVAHLITSQDYQLNMSPSVDDDPQTTMNNFNFAEGALDSGFLEWVKESDGSTALRSNFNEGKSYFSTMWYLKGPNAADNTSRMNTYVNNFQKNEDIPGYLQPINLADDFTAQKVANGPTVTIDGQKDCPTRYVTAVTEAGRTVVDQWAYYQYVDANGEQATGAVLYGVQNVN